MSNLEDWRIEIESKFERLEQQIAELQKVKVNWGVQIKHWFEEYYNPKVDNLEEVLRDHIKSHKFKEEKGKEVVTRGILLNTWLAHLNSSLEKLDVGSARQTEKKDSYDHRGEYDCTKLEGLIASGGEKELPKRENGLNHSHGINGEPTAHHSKPTEPKAEPEKSIGKSNSYYKGYEDCEKGLIDEFVKKLDYALKFFTCSRADKNWIISTIKEYKGRLKK